MAETEVYHKLVRDRIPSLIRAEGGVPETHVLSEEQYAQALNEKLAEETEEFLRSSDVEELADVYEVLLAILKSRGISIEEFEELRRKKACARGSFDDKIFLVSVLRDA